MFLFYLYSPCSDCESSVASCTELIAALEALTIELQENKLQENKRQQEKQGTGVKEDHAETEGHSTAGELTRVDTLTRMNCGMAALEGRQSPVKSLTAESATKINTAEKEKILKECKTQIKV